MPFTKNTTTLYKLLPVESTGFGSYMTASLLSTNSPTASYSETSGVPREVSIYCTAGVATTNLIGDLPGYGAVRNYRWYRQYSFAGTSQAALPSTGLYYTDTQPNATVLVNKVEKISLKKYTNSDYSHALAPATCNG